MTLTFFFWAERNFNFDDFDLTFLPTKVSKFIKFDSNISPLFRPPQKPSLFWKKSWKILENVMTWLFSKKMTFRASLSMAWRSRSVSTNYWYMLVNPDVWIIAYIIWKWSVQVWAPRIRTGAVCVCACANWQSQSLAKQGLILQELLNDCK